MVDPAHHRPWVHACLTPCVICDAPENDELNPGFEVSDRPELVQDFRNAGASADLERCCTRCWVQGAKERWEREQAEQLGEALGKLFAGGSVEDLD